MSDELDNADELLVVRDDGTHRLKPRMTVGDLRRLYDRIAELERQLQGQP